MMHASKAICSGCMACKYICPTGCIEIDTSNRIRFIKMVDHSKCVNCHLCEKVCPHSDDIRAKKSIYGYNAWSNKRSVLRRSSSGGIASMLYEYGVENNIKCVGVSFDERLNLYYVFLDDCRMLRDAAGSKYVFSRMDKVYEGVRSYLIKGEQVLFVGLPCHVSALKKYCELKGISQDGLITVDVVCHGIVMPYFFEKHIKKFVFDNKEKSIRFREKNNQYGISVFSEGNLIYKRNRYEDEYMMMFLEGIYSDSCYHCKYACELRVGDFTIKDCSTEWENREKNIVHNQSSVMINTEVGKRIWDDLMKNKVDGYTYPITSIIKEDSMLRHPSNKPFLYGVFLLLESMAGYTITTNVLWKIKALIRNVLDSAQWEI